MKPEDILDAIGNVDDRCVVKAKESRRSNVVRVVLGTIGSVAAGLIVMFLLLNIMNFIGYSSGGPAYGGKELPEKSIRIYYVENGELKSETEQLKPVNKYVVETWKEKNGIGEEVRIQRSIVQEGDYLTMIIVISKNIENYYDTVDKDMLLESLKLTMSYTGEEIDEYNISFM